MRLEDCTCGKAWEVNLGRFRIYLKEKYNVKEAHYFMGYLREKNDELYKEIQKAGFIISFKEHSELLKTKKKGNIDADLVFAVLRTLLEDCENSQKESAPLKISKVVLVSGDGDYKKLVNYLIAKGKFEKILFPNKKYASSLYNQYGSEIFDYLENIKTYIA